KLDRAGLRAGARVATDKYEKESASDFALWKRAGEGDDLLGAAWPSPWGAGRPGWHIECSAMAMRYLGQTLDVHCGGVDLKFPHHENEIAQSEAFTGLPFARFWLHNEMLADLSGEKMSKSTGNIATLRDLLAAGHDPVAIRYYLVAGARHRRPPPRIAARARRAARGFEVGGALAPELIHGRNPVLEAARAGRVRRVLLAAGLKPDPRLTEIRRLAQVEEVPAARLESLAPGGVHQGAVAQVATRRA